jgi:hypothetical protein
MSLIWEKSAEVFVAIVARRKRQFIFEYKFVLIHVMLAVAFWFANDFEWTIPPQI